MKKFLRRQVLPRLVFWIYWLIYKTWKIEFVESAELKTRWKNGQGFLLAHWHGDELALAHVIHRYRIATLASPSEDGFIADAIIRNFGGISRRGSSSKKGASGLLGLVKICKRENAVVSFAVDGPRGPLHIPKPGALEFAKLLSYPIFAVGADADRKWTQTRSWNQAFLPKPFARLVIYFSDSFFSEVPDPKNHQHIKLLSDAIAKAKAEAAKHVAALK